MSKVWKWNAAVAVAAAVILVTTLLPVSQAGSSLSEVCVFCGERGGADFLLNLALFAPFGFALAGRGLRLRWIALFGGLLAASIEVAQFGVVPGRDASLGDLLSNTLGAALGGMVWAGWVRLPTEDSRMAALLPLAAAGAGAAVPLIGLALLTPDFPPGPYLQRWTPRFPGSEVYQGEVLVSAIGPLELSPPPGTIEPADSVRRLLMAGAPLHLDVLAAPPPESLAPVFGLYQGERHEMVMVGADGHDLVFRYRPLAARLRLDRAEIRFAGALAPVEAGEPAAIIVDPSSSGVCASVNGRSHCVPELRAGDTWTLLSHVPARIAGLSRVAGALWLAALFLPAGLLGRRWRDLGAAALTAVLGLTLIPLVAGFPVTGMETLAAAVLGVLLGGVLRYANGRAGGHALQRSAPGGSGGRTP